MATKWQTARDFISSTFRDMHAERNHKTKVRLRIMQNILCNSRPKATRTSFSYYYGRHFRASSGSVRDSLRRQLGTMLCMHALVERFLQSSTRMC